MTHCPFCAERGWDHDEIKKKCDDSLFYFTYYIVSDWVTHSFHKPICDWFQDELQRGQRFILVMLPRGHLKTTTFNIAFNLWLITHNPDIRILVAMASGREAWRKCGKMQRKILSAEFKHFWPHLVPNIADVVWNKGEFEVVRNHEDLEEPTITGLGTETKMTGGHYDVHVLDDPIDGLGAASEVQSQRAIDFMQACEGLWVRRSEGIEIVIATAWPGPFYEGLVDNELYSKVILGCRVDDRWRNFLASRGLECLPGVKDGDVIFPEHETEESLKVAEKKFGPMYPHQMLNLFVDDSLRQFRRDDCQPFEWGDPTRSSVRLGELIIPVQAMFIQMTIDPGTGAAGGDESAIVVTGWSRTHGMAFALDAWCERVLTNRLVDTAFEMAERWNVNVIRPESVGYQRTLTDYMREVQMRRQRHFVIDPVKPGTKAKGERIIASLQPFVASRQVFFRKDQPHLVEELVNLKVIGGKVHGRSPNLADALAYHTEYWRVSPPSFREPEFEDVDDDYEVYNVPVRYGLRCPTRSTGVF